MALDAETRALVTEMVDELYEGLVEDRALLFWEGGIVRSAPTGAPPEFITVEIEGLYDENVHWRGVPPTPAVGDEVVVWENPITHRREILGGSGATGTSGGSYCQKVTVAVCGGDFTTLGAAVTWINALPAAQVPSATRLYAVNVLGGTFVEGANVTIPQYVDVSGEGESSVIDMGANSLLMSDNSSLLDLKVKSSNPSYAIAAVAKDDVVLRNVHCIQTAVSGTPDCFHFSAGCTNVRVYDCYAEIPANGVGFHILGASVAGLHTCTTSASAKDATTYGFQIGDTAVATLDYCTADDVTYFNDALHLDNTFLTCTTRWCTFRAYDNDVNIAGSSVTWYHLDCHFDPDNSTIVAGTHFALPTKRFNQTVIVAELGGDFQALSEAIAWINALGDAAFNKLYGVLMLHGNFAEAGNVTIPSYVHVFGMGEGTEIELASNYLALADHSSLQNVVVESYDSPTIYINNADPWLRNVHAISSDAGGGVVFNIDGTSSPMIYDCIAEATQNALTCYYFQGTGSPELYRCQAISTGSGANLTGYSIVDACDVLLEHCIADDTTDILTGLSAGVGANATVTTRHCTFAASGNDVTIQSGSTWVYYGDNFDPDNCTISGIADPADGQEVVYFDCSKTAGAAGDFATVQAAIDWFKNRNICALATIDIVTGATYAETLVIEDVFCTARGRLELEGDPRGMAAATWVDGAAVTCQDANAGSGVCTLANAGAVITVTGAGGNPDFDADGWVNGDTVITRDNAGAVATYTISATLNNTITLTVAAPAVGNTGTSMTLVPNTVIAPSGAGNAVEVIESRGILLDGLHLDATAGATGHGLYVHDGGGCACENILAEADDRGFLAEWGAFIEADDGACTAVECSIGFYVLNQGYILADYGVAVGCGAAGFYGAYSGFVEADYAVATDCVDGFAGQWLGGCVCRYAYAFQNGTYGFHAGRQGFVRCNDSRTAATNGTDYRADYNSYMFATNTNVGGPTYSPAVSDTEGNVFGIITFS